MLRPGWNMVGWVGPTTPVWHLFEEIEALRVVATQHETTRDYRYAWPGRQDEFPTLTPGMGLWLYVSATRRYAGHGLPRPTVWCSG